MKLYVLGIISLCSINAFASEFQPTFCKIFDSETKESIGSLKIDWLELDRFSPSLNWTEKAKLYFSGAFHNGEYEIQFNRESIRTRCAGIELASASMPNVGSVQFGWNSYGSLGCDDNNSLKDYGVLINEKSVTKFECN